MKAALALLDSRRPVIEQIIPQTLQGSITWESIRTSVALALGANQRLQEADPQTVYASVLYILRLGLEIGGHGQQAYLVPFKGTCTPMIGAQGKIELAMRSGKIDALTAQIVYERDHFDVDFLQPGANSHKPAFGDRGKPVLCYAAIWVKGASIPLLEIMSAEDFEKIKADAVKRSGGKPSPAYTAWPLEMWRRSCLNRALKRAPKSRDLWEALSTQTAIDLGGKVTVDKVGHVDVIDASPEAYGALPDFSEVDDIDARAAEAVGIEPEPIEAKPEAKPAPAKRKPAAEPAPAAASDDDDGAP